MIPIVAITAALFHFLTMAHAMNELTDWLSGIQTWHGPFSAATMAAIRLVYQRGLFDGFVAGVLLVLILKRDRGSK